MISPATDRVGVEIIESLTRFGFDYIELSLSDTAALSLPEFNRLKQRIGNSGIPCEACNNFFPARVRLTGSEVKLSLALEYAKAAMERAAELGARVIVFGSSGAKNVPPGFPKAAAWKQLVELLQRLGSIAAPYGITIAIEPLNQKESNLINRAAEGLELAQAVNHANVQLLIDYYHLMMEQEDSGIILIAGPVIRHVHFAQVDGRIFPTEANENYLRFFGVLRQAGYAGRCSIEAYTQNFAVDAPRARKLIAGLTSAGRAAETNWCFQPTM